MTTIGKVCSAIALDESGEINIVGYKNEAEKLVLDVKVGIHVQCLQIYAFFNCKF